MSIEHPANVRVIAHLSARRAQAPLLAEPDSVELPYYHLGSHPDIVERVWDELAAPFPQEARKIVCGTPGLVHPDSGAIFALAYGTRYVLRLPGGLAEEAVRAGAPTLMRWSGGEETNAREALGEGWVFGAWLNREPEWLQQAYDIVGEPGFGS
jgi:hypothetical protein